MYKEFIYCRENIEEQRNERRKKILTLIHTMQPLVYTKYKQLMHYT